MGTQKPLIGCCGKPAKESKEPVTEYEDASIILQSSKFIDNGCADNFLALIIIPDFLT